MLVNIYGMILLNSGDCVSDVVFVNVICSLYVIGLFDDIKIEK